VTTPEHEQLSYEQAREELVSVVQRLESGGVPLEESLALWERGERLADLCQEWLDGARARVEAARSESLRDNAGGTRADTDST
jgi:exodeoxyribonuclease VII small subunit